MGVLCGCSFEDCLGVLCGRGGHLLFQSSLNVLCAGGGISHRNSMVR